MPNLGELRAIVVEKLREGNAGTGTPKYWTVTEINRYINRGVREFARVTECNVVRAALVQASQGRYLLPADALKIERAYWGQNPLAPVTTRIMDNMYPGTGRFPGVRAEPTNMNLQWDQMTGDPMYYMLEAGLLLTFPVPPAPATVLMYRNVSRSTLPAGTTTIVTTISLPSDKNQVDLWIDGVHQDPLQFNVTGANTIVVVGVSAVDLSVAVSVSAVSPYRTVETSTVAAGTFVITTSNIIPTDKAQIDLWIDGVYQNSAQFIIAGPKTIVLTSSSPVNTTATLAFISGSSTLAYPAVKYSFDGIAGQSSFSMPLPYVMGVNAEIVYVDGIAQQQGADFTETSPYAITLTAPLAVDAVVDIVVVGALANSNANVRYVKSPASMIADTDVPDLPFGLDQFHDAAWYWALFECFDREGQTQDKAKAAEYLMMAKDQASKWREAFGPPVLVYPQDAWRV